MTIATFHIDYVVQFCSASDGVALAIPTENLTRGAAPAAPPVATAAARPLLAIVLEASAQSSGATPSSRPC